MTAIKNLILNPRQLSFEMLRGIYDQPVTFSLPDSAYDAIDASHEEVRTIIARDKVPTVLIPVLAYWQRRELTMISLSYYSAT